jgi:hypothetical protein
MQLALVILGQNSLPLARRIMAALPEVMLYGLANRTADRCLLYELWQHYTGIIHHRYAHCRHLCCRYSQSHACPASH